MMKACLFVHVCVCMCVGVCVCMCSCVRVCARAFLSCFYECMCVKSVCSSASVQSPLPDRRTGWIKPPFRFFSGSSSALIDARMMQKLSVFSSKVLPVICARWFSLFHKFRTTQLVKSATASIASHVCARRVSPLPLQKQMSPCNQRLPAWRISVWQCCNWALLECLEIKLL